MASPAEWIEGARLRTLPLALALIVAGSVAAAELHSFRPVRAVLALLVAFFLQVGVNYANDYSDGVKGTDEGRVGPMRLVGSGAASPKAVKFAAFLCFGLAVCSGVLLVALANLVGTLKALQPPHNAGHPFFHALSAHSSHLRRPWGGSSSSSRFFTSLSTVFYPPAPAFYGTESENRPNPPGVPFGSARIRPHHENASPADAKDRDRADFTIKNAGRPPVSSRRCGSSQMRPLTPADSVEQIS